MKIGFLIGVLLSLVCATLAEAQAGALRVRVQSDAEPLQGAEVSLLRADSTVVLRAATDADGSAQLNGVAAGRYIVRVQRIGYSGFTRELTIAQNIIESIVVELQPAAVGLPAVLVESQRQRVRFEESAGATTSQITQRDLKLLPALGEPDVLRALEVLPGVVSTSDFSSAFNVRGGGADQNLILLDGLPIYNPFHLGGLFSVFNSDMVSRTELLAGGFPARYGSRVSSVVTVESDAGAAGLDVNAGVSVLATRVAVGFDLPEAPLRSVGLSAGRMRVSGRRSYFDQLLKPFFDFPYHLTDLQLHSEAWTSDGGRVTLTAYTGRDVLDLTGVESFPLKVRWDWGNTVAGASWAQPLGNGRALDLRIGHTHFDTGLGFPEFGDTDFSSRMDQSLLRADFTAPHGDTRLGAGVALDYLDYHNIAASGGTVFGEGFDRGWLVGSYVEAVFRPGAWLIETGLRADVWDPRTTAPLVAVQPRLAVKRFLREQHAVKLAVGRYVQHAHSLRDEELPIGLDIWVLSGDRAPVVRSDQIQAGIESFFHPDWFGAVEGYYRRFRGVALTNTAEDPNVATDDLLSGTGRSYGVDLQLRRDRGRIRPALALSWLRATRDFPDVTAGVAPAPIVRYAPIYDRRIDMDVVLQAELPRGFMLGARWNLGTGLPYTRPLGSYAFYDYSLLDGVRRPDAGEADTTSAVVLGPRNGERYPTYMRLDVGVRRTFQKSWGTMTPFLDVLNLFDKRNVLFYFYQYAEAPPQRSGVSMFPLLPTAGLEVRF